jgi:hypothetical protein
VDGSSERPTGKYFFRVKTKDIAGNWGSSSLFIYDVLTDDIKPKAAFSPATSSRWTDGRYLAASASTTILLSFDKPIQEDTVLSSGAVRFYGIRDNMAETKTVPLEFNVVYDPVRQESRIEPKDLLPKGWLFEVVVTTVVIKDLADNPIESEIRMRFETLMDRNVHNRILAGDGKTVIDILPGAFEEDFSPSIGLIAGGISPQAPGAPAVGIQQLLHSSQDSLTTANKKIVDLFGPYAQPVTIREFTALAGSGGLLKSNFSAPVTVALPYLDEDGDGFVDGTSPRVMVKNLQMAVLDESNNLWLKIPNAEVNTINKTITARIAHFSLYSVMGSPDLDVSKSYAFPVPFRPSQGDKNITFTQLPSEGKIRIYTVSGELVKKMDFSDLTDSKIIWDVANDSGDNLGSDVYIYVIESGSNKKMGKIMVVR